MQYLLVLVILFATGCSGQSNNSSNKVDTSKLFNPNPQANDLGAEEVNIFKRNIILTNNNYYAVLNDKEHTLESLDKVKDFIKSNKEEIIKRKFYVIIDSNTSFQKTFSVINLLVENQVTNYKVINTQEFFTPSQPVVMQTPTVTTIPYNENDSTTFQIEILKTGINLKLLGQEIKLSDTTGLDKFINLHKSDIKKIFLINTPDLPKEKFLAVLEILKRNEYKKFSLITKQ